MLILDELLENGVITHEDHNASLKLKKMHDTIFGNTIIKAYDPSRIKGRSCRKINERYLCNVEAEYNSIVDMLIKNNLWDIVSDICIYQNDKMNWTNMNRLYYISALKDGLEIISSHFKNGERNVGKLKNLNKNIMKLELI